jgi:hypothetical protein
LFIVSEKNLLTGHAFISYAHANSGKVDQLQRALETAGIRVWRDATELSPGEDWHARIRDAITQNSLAFIACFSRQSVARMASYQNEELTLAIEEMRKRSPGVPWLIPVRLNDCDIPDRDIGGGRTLSSIHRADLFGPGAKASADKLVAVVLKILRRDSIAPGAVGPPAPPTSTKSTTTKGSAAKRPSATVLNPAINATPLGDPSEGVTHTNALPEKGRLPNSRVASPVRVGMPEPRRRSASPDDLVKQFADLDRKLERLLGMVDDEPQRMDTVSGEAHQLVGRIWSVAKNQLFDTEGSPEDLLPSDVQSALEEARDQENDALELYTDKLHRYQRDGKKGRDLLDNRRAYISALRAFRIRVSATVEYLN